MSQLRNIFPPLVRDGKSQDDRLRDSHALLPETIQLDSSTEKSLLAYLYEFAKAVAHYDTETGEISNWQDFFRGGASVQVARIHAFDTTRLQTLFIDARTRLEQGLSRGDFSPLLDFLFETVSNINDWHQGLADDLVVVDETIVHNVTPLQQKIAALVATNLREPLNRLLATANCIKGYSLPNLQHLRTGGLFWENTLEADRAISARDLVLQRLAPRPSRFQAATLEQLTGIFEIFNNTVRQIVADAKKADLLQPTQVHEPHLGLLYSFLRLFSHVQADFNDLTRRHLDFYYSRVLGFKPRPHTPDAAHLIFELNRPFIPYALRPDTRVLDGKDGKADIEFGLANEIVVTRTQVASLRTLFLGNYREENGSTQKLFAAPIANSADGKGGGFKDTDDTSWPTLGSAATRPVNTGDPVSEMPQARVGLLISSPALRLAEGNRIITITLPVTLPSGNAIPSLEGLNTAATFQLTKKAAELLKINKLTFQPVARAIYVADDTDKVKMNATLIKAWNIHPQNDLVSPADLPDGFIDLLEKTKVFDAWLSGKKGWFRASDVSFDWPDDNNIEIKITLGVKDEPVIVADPEVLKADYKVTEPLLKLVLNQEIDWQTPDGQSIYDLFSTAQLGAVVLDVYVTDMHSLIVRNDDGLLDASKSFMPFGAQPAAGSSWYIGSDEVFRKSLKDMTLHIEWDKLPPNLDFGAHYAAYAKAITGTVLPEVTNLTFTAKQLVEGKFDQEINSYTPPDSNSQDKYLFDASSSVKNIKLEGFGQKGRLLQAAPLTDLNGSTASGFIKISTDRDFLHSLYAKVVAISALNASKTGYTELQVSDLKTAIKSINCSDPNCATKKANVIAAVDLILGAVAPGAAISNTELDHIHTAINGLNCTDPDCATKKSTINKQIEDLFVVGTPPNPPYTPLIKSLTLDYHAIEDEGDANAAIQVWHLHPYEDTNRSLRSESGGGVVPQYINPEKSNRPLQGTLLIGLQYAHPGEIAHILFQLHEPSADTYLPQASVEWHYLHGNEWRPLIAGKHLLSDETEGLIRSGVIRLVVPFDIDSSATTILPGSYLWLRVSTTEPTDTICRALGVHLQAVKSVFAAKEGNTLSRPGKPLPAGSLKKFVTPPAELKPPVQPYKSFGGRAKEQAEDFYRRVSERLRHKGRAVTLWDYEQLVLEAFPDIFKVKCIPHTLPERRTLDPRDRPVAPGFVTVAVVPNLVDRPLADRLEPKVARGQLAEIHHFLSRHTSPFVRLSVMNPVIERIQTQFKVKFLPGKSPEFYKNKLAVDLERYLNPWAYGDQGKLTFGGRVLRSSLLGFIEKCEYVDYVTDFKMFKEGESTTDANEITTSSVRGILVSGSKDHSIDYY